MRMLRDYRRNIDITPHTVRSVRPGASVEVVLVAAAASTLPREQNSE